MPTRTPKPAETEEAREARIDALLADLSLEEKVAMLSGHGFFQAIQEDGGRYCARPYAIGGGNQRLGIPSLSFNDGPRGVAMGASTCFPVPMARGACFDVELEERIGEAIARELRAQGATLFGGVCINLLRHPAWGRAQETYGEDPFLLGAMGAALVRGVQRHNVVATVKHFAANSMENKRFEVDVRIAERPLREVYLRHFEHCVGEGVGAVMSAYNRLNGAFCGHHEALLTRILKEEWGFDGFVYSDFVLGCRGAEACAAGLDVEAPDTIHFGGKLVAAVREGRVSQARVDDAVRRVLRILLRFAARPDPERYGPEQVACASHRALAREAARKSLVLLRNEAVLPWDPGSLRRVVVLGPLAARPNLGDHGSSRVRPPSVATPLDGLRAALPAHCELIHDPGDDLARVRHRSASAHAVLVVAGLTHEHEGEFIPGTLAVPTGDSGKAIGGDRAELGLPADQEALILAAAEAQPRCAVALMAGSALCIEGWRQRVGAILLLWYPGMEGGHALAEVLLGRASPSGHLPFSMPRRPEDLPFFDREATDIEYDLWHGYTHLEREGRAPAFPFGFGLSYTRFVVGSPAVSLEGQDALRVRARVRNAGGRAGEVVVQVYAGLRDPDPEQPRKRLCAFARVALAAGEEREVALPVSLRDLAFFDPDARRWRLGGRHWRLHVGTSSDGMDCVQTTVVLPERSWARDAAGAGAS